MREVRQTVHPVLDSPADVIDIDRACNDHAGGGVHLPSDERDVVVERAPLFSMVETRSAPPARADVMIGQEEGLELQRHAAPCCQRAHPGFDYLNDTRGVAVSSVTSDDGEYLH
jgi:hypothetical protein